MKGLFALLFLMALPAMADQVITNTYTDGQAARITKAMNRANAASCAAEKLPASCDTTQLRTAFCTRIGYPGVSQCAGSTQFIIYPNITVFAKRTLLDKIAEWQKADEAEDKAAAKAAWDAKTQAQRDALCPSFGLTAPCTPF